MRISHTIKVLVTSDFLINAGFSVFTPVLAVFVTGQITGGTIRVVGFAAAIAQIVKSVLQVPVAHWLDKDHGEFDDFYALITGCCIIASTPFFYMFASHAWHIYAIQAWFGLGTALAVPPWYAIFTRHIDKMHENIEWSLESVAIGIGGASTAALSGVIVTNLGYRAAFFVGGILAMIGAWVVIHIYADLRRYVGRREVVPKPDAIG